MTWPSLPLRRLSVSGALILLFGCHGGGGGGTTTPTPSFTLSVSPASLSIPSGGGGRATGTVTRIGGFSDAVVLSLIGTPSGVLGSGTVAAGAQTGLLSVTVASGVAPQTLNNLNVKGTAGSLLQTAAFNLTVAPPLPVGELSPDRVQAIGGLQQGGGMTNVVLGMEPMKAATAKDASGQTEVRHDFNPNAIPF